MCSKAFRQTVETTRSRPLSIQAYVGETRPKSVDDDAIGTFYDYFFYLTEKKFLKTFWENENRNDGASGNISI